MYTSEADFHKPGIYGGSVRVWANAWDVLRRTASRGGRGLQWIYFVVCFERWDFVGKFLYFERTRPAARMRPPCLIYLSTRNEARPSERSDRGRFCK